MALVPRQSADIVLYTDGLSRKEERRIEAQIREDDLQEYRHARHHRLRASNAMKLVQQIGDSDADLIADRQAKLQENDDPMLEDFSDDLLQHWKVVSRRILHQGYGNG